jgi:two-component system sensor histidine kinase/response regulator
MSAVAPKDSSAGTITSAEPVRILLVDDQPDNLLSAEAVLESLGEKIVKAESGREALRQLLEHDFAVIVLDVMMPDMDGFETAALIRERERSRHTPIIFLTALGRGEEHIRRGYTVGAADYLTKPFVPEILRTKVSVFMELHRKSALLRHQSQQLERQNSELQEAIQRSWRAEEEIKALNRHLERRVGELDDLNRELETFSYTVSHDLRGPLSRVSGFSRALLESYRDQLDDQGRLYLNRIDQSARRMNQLVEDLLSLSRVTRVEMTRQIVDLSGIVHSIAAELLAREPARAVEFVVAEDVHAWGDPDLLRAALLNLLENSWKFTRKHDRARIEFGVMESPKGHTYFLGDDGAGFEMAQAGRLFNPFQRLHKSSDFEGTGVGLATVERIVRRHGGQIWAEGHIEHGATFYFTLSQEAKS